MVSNEKDGNGRHGLTFTSDNQRLLGGGQDGVWIWDLTNEKPVIERKLPMAKQWTHHVAISPDNKHVAASTSGWDGTVDFCLFDLPRPEGPPRRPFPAGERIEDFAFLSEGRMVIDNRRHDGVLSSLRLVDVKADPPRILDTWWPPGDAARPTLAIHPDGKFLILSRGDKLHRIAIAGDKFVPADEWQSPGPIESVAFSPDGKTLAAGGHDGGLRLWDLSGAKPRRIGPEISPSELARCLALTADGKRLAVGHVDGTVRLFDATAEPLVAGAVFASQILDVSQLAFSPDGATLAGVNYSGHLALWDVRGNEPVLLSLHHRSSSATLSQYTATPRALAFSPDGKTVAFRAVGGELWVQSMPGGQVKQLGGPKSRITSLAFSPDGKILAGGGDAQLVLWDMTVDPPRNLTQFQMGDEDRGNLAAVDWLADGKSLWAAGGTGNGGLSGKIWRFELSEGRLHPQVIHASKDFLLWRSGSMSRDGTRLATVSRGGRILILRPDGKILANWFASGAVNDVTLSPHGRTIYTINGNGTVFVLRLGK